MANSTYIEIQSVMWKFSQLSSLGINSNLNFSSNNGKVCVPFTVELGDITRNTQNQNSSRLRRRHRRAKARVEFISEENVNSVQNTDMAFNSGNPVHEVLQVQEDRNCELVATGVSSLTGISEEELESNIASSV